MASNGRKKPNGQSGNKPASRGRQAPPPEVRTAVGSGPAKSATKRANKTGVDKTQIYIMGVAVVVIIAVIIFGFVLNQQNTEAQNEGYGSARSTVATVADGVITVSGQDPTSTAITIDVFEDPLCPFCGALERQFGQQMAQAMDEGKLNVNYHLLTFLDGKAASPDFSTRASGAMMCVAQEVGDEPGVYSRFHDQLFSMDVQPTEGGDEDLTNEQFVEQLVTARTGAQAAGSPKPASEAGFTAASECILGNANAALVATGYASATDTLNAAVGAVRSPVVLHNGVPVNTDDVNWLTTLLGGPVGS